MKSHNKHKIDVDQVRQIGGFSYTDSEQQHSAEKPSTEKKSHSTHHKIHKALKKPHSSKPHIAATPIAPVPDTAYDRRITRVEVLMGAPDLKTPPKPSFWQRLFSSASPKKPPVPSTLVPKFQ